MTIEIQMPKCQNCPFVIGIGLKVLFLYGLLYYYLSKKLSIIFVRPPRDFPLSLTPSFQGGTENHKESYSQLY